MNKIVGVALLVLGGVAAIAVLILLESSRDMPGIGVVFGCGTGLVCGVPGAFFLLLAPGVRNAGRVSIIVSMVGASVIGGALALLCIGALHGPTALGCFTLPVSALCVLQIYWLAEALMVPRTPAWRGFEPVMPVPPQPRPPADDEPSA
ncbi:MAG: hypothetical protein ACHRHE_11010 [Tepidisphaerales bacterium]